MTIALIILGLAFFGPWVIAFFIYEMDKMNFNIHLEDDEV